MKKASDGELFPCPCCGVAEMSEPGCFEICDTCGWEDDPAQEGDLDLAGGANQLSLNQARVSWKGSQKPQTETE